MIAYIVYKKTLSNGEVNIACAFTNVTTMNSYIENANKEWGKTLHFYTGPQLTIYT